MIKTSQIDSLTNFQKNTKQFVESLESSKDPLVLTVNGKAKLVVQDAAAYQALLDQTELIRFQEAVRAGIEDAEAGNLISVKELRAEFAAKYGI
jgi:PHD/YefM family antitoxin component YafN of YafNO toxin-antitoxin module